jgi:hypothetical protein
MREIRERLYIGSDADCRQGKNQWAVVHACKTCHQKAVGYTGSLSSKHPLYLTYETPNDLYLNIIDPPGPLFLPELFTTFLNFAKRNWKDEKNLLIHCNQGGSRAPSLAMLFLAKNINDISNKSFLTARAEFVKLFPLYNPGRGIQDYLRANWRRF